MNILASISSFNSKAGVKRCVEAQLAQTYPPREILIVDNRSSDGTTLQTYPSNVTLVCNLRNLGVAGAAWTAFQYALANGYDWIWVLDQDSIPRKDALLKLIELYESFPPHVRSRTGVLSSLCVCQETGKEVHGALLTPRGKKIPRFGQSQIYYECDATIWSGSMYNLQAIRSAGPPKTDFWMDWADLELGFRIKAAGYHVFVHRGSILEHTIGEVIRIRWWGGRALSSHPANRVYVRYRNMTYFWLYLHPSRSLIPVIINMSGGLIKELAKFLLTEKNPGPKISACFLGIWNGWRKNLSSQVEV